MAAADAGGEVDGDATSCLYTRRNAPPMPQARDGKMSRFRRLLHWVRAQFLVATGAVWWAKRQLRQSRCVIVLAFHRVLDDGASHQTNSLPGIIMTRTMFESLVTHVASRYEPVDLSQARPGEPSHTLRMVFTFDDGWSDNYTHALPIARAHGIPLAVFVCPGLMGMDAPFWPEQISAGVKAARPAARNREIEQLIEHFKLSTPDQRQRMIADLSRSARPPVETDRLDSTMSWAQISGMDAAGVNIGCHTQTHQILTTVPERDARLEINDAKNAIERALKKRCDLFAYPNGNHSLRTRRLLAEAGFELAFTTTCGAWTAGCDPLAIPRINLHDDKVAGPAGSFSRSMFEHAVFWKAWRAMRTRVDNRSIGNRTGRG